MANFFKKYYEELAAKRSVNLGTGVFAKQFDPPADLNNPHYFLAEETLVPRLRNSDTQRINMFASHFSQTVHLVHPEYPKVFTNFENQVGEYSIGYKKAKDDFTIVAKIPKNKLNYDLIVKYNSTGVYDVIHYRHAAHITEDYGYEIDDCLPNAKAGDIVKKDSYVYKDTSYDDDGNFEYGVNLKAVYIPWQNYTYEDAIVVTESAAKKLTSYKVESIDVSVNTNDILLDLYSAGPGEYHSFPHVGEMTDGNVLVASRRYGNKTLLYDFKYDKLQELQSDDDITYTQGGMVTDLDIYSNVPLDVFAKRTDKFSKEVYEELKMQHEYYENCAEVLDKIIPVAKYSDLMATMTPEDKEALYNEKKVFGFNWTRPLPKQLNVNKYTEDLGYFWKQVHEYLDDRIKWKSKGGKAFSNIRMKFTILKENPLSIGAKITNRYGGKGVISAINFSKFENNILR